MNNGSDLKDFKVNYNIYIFDEKYFLCKKLSHKAILKFCLW